MIAVFAFAILGLCVLGYLFGKKYVARLVVDIYKESGINILNKKSQVISSFIMLPMITMLFVEDLIEFWYIPLAFTGIFILAIFVKNARLPHPVASSCVQVVWGLLFSVRIVIWLFALVASVGLSIMCGGRFPVKYNPFGFADIEDDQLMYYKKDIVMFDEPISEYGVIDDPNVCAREVNRSRNISEKNRLLNELAAVQEEKEYAMIYGFEDISVYEEQENQIKSKLAKI